MNCIIKYMDKNNKCYCNKLKECSRCNNQNNRITNEKCNVTINGYCTCRACGEAVRVIK